MEEEADKPDSAVHNIRDKVYIDGRRGWWFLFTPARRYENGKFNLRTDEASIAKDSKITLMELTRGEILKSLSNKIEHTQFTAEKQDDYPDDNGPVPTLDCKVCINEEDNEFILRFYKKPMASISFTPVDSAMGRLQ